MSVSVNTTAHLHTHATSSKASPADVRRNNRSLIFNLLYPSHAYSRAQLGRTTGLSRVAISDVTNDMLSEGLIYESGYETHVTGKGKRGMLLGVDGERLRIITIDLSQEHLISGEVTNLLGTPLQHAEIALDSQKGVDCEIIASLIERLWKEKPRIGNDSGRIIGIGIAATGVVHDGVILTSTEWDWHDVDLRGMLERRFAVPVCVTNDVICAMMTERFFGKGSRNLLFVKIDRGIGAATLVNDIPIVGENYASGEIGHIVVDPDGAQCPCGKRGCLETILSAPALRERMARAANENERRQVIADAGEHLAQAIAMPVGLLDMGDVCVWGPPDIVNDVFIDTAQRYLNRSTASNFHKRTTIRRCQCGQDITLRGATVAVAQAAATGGETIASRESDDI